MSAFRALVVFVLAVLGAGGVRLYHILQPFTTVEPTAGCTLVSEFIDRSSGRRVSFDSDGFEDLLTVVLPTTASRGTLACGGNLVHVWHRLSVAPESVPRGTCFLVTVGKDGELVIDPVELQGFPKQLRFHPHGGFVGDDNRTVVYINHAYGAGGERMDVFRLEESKLEGGSEGASSFGLRYTGTLMSPYTANGHNGIMNDVVVNERLGLVTFTSYLPRGDPITGRPVPKPLSALLVTKLKGVLGLCNTTVHQCRISNDVRALAKVRQVNVDLMANATTVSPDGAWKSEHIEATLTDCQVMAGGYGMANGINVVTLPQLGVDIFFVVDVFERLIDIRSQSTTVLPSQRTPFQQVSTVPMDHTADNVGVHTVRVQVDPHSSERHVVDVQLMLGTIVSIEQAQHVEDTTKPSQGGATLLTARLLVDKSGHIELVHSQQELLVATDGVFQGIASAVFLPEAHTALLGSFKARGLMKCPVGRSN